MSSPKRKDAPDQQSIPSKAVKVDQQGYYILQWSMDKPHVRSAEIVDDEAALHQRSKEVVTAHFQQLAHKTIRVAMVNRGQDDDDLEDVRDVTFDDLVALDSLAIASIGFCSNRGVVHVEVDDSYDIQLILELLKQKEPFDEHDLRLMRLFLDMEMDAYHCQPQNRDKEISLSVNETI